MRFLPWLLVCAHSIAVVSWAIFIGSGLSVSSEALMLWGFFMAIDFPTGWLIIPIGLWLESSVGTAHGLVGENIFTAVMFLMLGGAQYFCVGRLILWLRKRRKVHDLLPSCRSCGYCLRGLTEPRCPECGTPFSPDLIDEDSAKP